MLPLIPLRNGAARGFNGLLRMLIRLCGYPSWNRQLEVRALLGSIHLSKDATVLDVGCGTGVFDGELALKGNQVIGLDIDQGAIRVAHQRYGSTVRFIVADATRLPIRDGALDVVVGLSSIEHFDDLEVFLKSAHQCLRRSGALVIVADKEFTLGWIWKFIPHFLLKNEVKSMVQRGMDLDKAAMAWHRTRYGVRRYVTPEDFRLFYDAGFRITHYRICITRLWGFLFDGYCVLKGFNFANVLHRILSLALNLFVATDMPSNKGKSLLISAIKTSDT